MTRKILDCLWLSFLSIALAFAILGVVACIATLAAEEHIHPTETITGRAAKFYARWNRMPTRDASCCNLKDCYATPFKNVGGTWFARIRETGQWTPIPAEKLEHNALDPEQSPDGASHVCANPHGHIFCAVVGSGQ